MTPETLPAIDCPHADRCSGCAWLAEPYPAQLDWKRAELAAALGRYPELRALNVEATQGAERLTEYRVRAKLVVSGRDVGLFARGSHDVVDIPECRVLRPAVARAVDAVRRSLPLPFALDAVDVREVDAGVLLTWITTEEPPPAALDAAAARVRALDPAIVGIALSTKPRGSPRVLGGAPRPLFGVAAAPHRLGASAPHHEATFGSFVQAHAQQASRLYTAVRRALEGVLGSLADQPILELHAGSGALALELAQAGARVTAVDSFEPSMRALERAARAQRLPVRAVPLTAEAAIDRFDRARALLVDPPRRGLSERVRTALARRRPEAVVYVSCSPPTLARDLAHLARLGFVATRVEPWDLIPLSDAVEALVTLVPGSPPPLTVLHQDDACLAIDKPPFDGDGALTRVREQFGWPDAVPIQTLDAETSGVWVFARHPDDAAALARSMKTQALALVRGIVHKQGTLARPRMRYRRERVVGTHSLVRAELVGADPQPIQRRFAAIGHPVLGDARHGDPASNRHFVERHGLDRRFLHVARVELELSGGRAVIEAPLAPDLDAVLESLGAVRSSDR